MSTQHPRTWAQRALLLKYEGLPNGKCRDWHEVAAIIGRETGQRLTRESIRNAVRNLPEYAEYAQRKTGGENVPPPPPPSPEEPEKPDEPEEEKPEPQLEPLTITEELGDHFIFGITSDTHQNSKYQQETHLHTFYDICQAEGVKVVYHAGDITAGNGRMYKGQQFEMFNQSVDEQEDYIVDNYPGRKGIVTKFITGNHCLSWFTSAGRDVGRAIGGSPPGDPKVQNGRREDMQYLGQYAAYVEFAPGVRMYLLHPDGGMPYAISYRPQRIAAGFAGGEKPNIMVMGHLHQVEYLFERNIHIIQPGCFEAQTPFLKRKGIMPKIGGWIIEVKIRDGSIVSFKPTFFPFYKHLVGDYKLTKREVV
jgi:predicted phosphodiesterase